MMKTNLFAKAVAIIMTVSMSITIAMPVTATAKEVDKLIKVENKTVHHLRDTGFCGATDHIGDSIPYEGLFGLKAEIKGTVVNYSMYTHNAFYQEGIVSLRSYEDVRRGKEGMNLGTIKVNESASFDLRSIAEAGKEAVYYLKIASNGKKAYMYLYDDGKKAWVCKYDHTSEKEAESWNRLIGKLDPKKCLEMYVGNPGYPITYPTSGKDGYCNDVSKWCELSDTLVNKNWTDNMKVFALVLYLTRNYAYDDWRVQTNNNVSRASLAQCWDDESLWMYENKVGNCWDFANVLTIMCRRQGIPCTSVENDEHTLNAVWMDDEWVAIDVSALVNHHCRLEDTDPALWRETRSGLYATDYGYYDSAMDTYNQALRTPATAVSLTARNPM